MWSFGDPFWHILYLSIIGSIPGSSSLHVDMFLGKILDPKLVPVAPPLVGQWLPDKPVGIL